MSSFMTSARAERVGPLIARSRVSCVLHAFVSLRAKPCSRALWMASASLRRDANHMSLAFLRSPEITAFRKRVPNGGSRTAVHLSHVIGPQGILADRCASPSTCREVGSPRLTKLHHQHTQEPVNPCSWMRSRASWRESRNCCHFSRLRLYSSQLTRGASGGINSEYLATMGNLGLSERNPRFGRGATFSGPHQ